MSSARGHCRLDRVAPFDGADRLEPSVVGRCKASSDEEGAHGCQRAGRHFNSPSSPVHLEIGVAIDNDVEVRWNGTDISGGVQTTENCPSLDRFVFEVHSDQVLATNVLAVRGIDRGSESYLNVRVSQATP